VEEIEEAMQKVMDQYAGGISSGYVFNLSKLQVAKRQIKDLLQLSYKLKAHDLHELMLIYEVIDRLYVCDTLIQHLGARKETRWHTFQENADYPERDDANWLKYVNSRFSEGEVKIILRDLVKKDDIYEHKD
jgi:adenylylsulfate reductase subunit A